MALNDALPIGVTHWLDEEPVGRPSAAALQPGVGHRVHGLARLIRRRFERSVRQAGLPITRLQASLGGDRSRYRANRAGANARPVA